MSRFNKEFSFAVLSHQDSLRTVTLKFPFRNPKNSLKLSIFAVRLLIFKCRIKTLFLFNCSDMAMKLSTEKYQESVCWGLSLKTFLSRSVLSLNHTDSKGGKIDSEFSNVLSWFWTPIVLKSIKILNSYGC